MFKHIIKTSFIFSILFLTSCGETGQSESEENQAIERDTGIVQSSQVSLDYPEKLSKIDIPLVEGATVIYVQPNKGGLRVWEKSDKDFDEVKAYYLEELVNNGWERKTDADKEGPAEQESGSVPRKYFETKYHKEDSVEKKKYVLLISFRTGKDGKTTIIKILERS